MLLPSIFCENITSSFPSSHFRECLFDISVQHYFRVSRNLEQPFTNIIPVETL